MAGRAGRVAVVTDSTAGLAVPVAQQHGIEVVPLRVTLGRRVVTDGVDVDARDLLAALREKLPVSTSRPTPDEFAARYRRLLDAGATHVVSVHLSSALSGTWESAVLASQDFDYGQVRVVDSRSTAMALGFAVLAAARRAETGGTAAEVQGAAVSVVDETRTLFYVDTLEHLRRGGRVGSAAALFATTLAVKPLLQLVEGQIVAVEKVRTSTKALARLEALAVAIAGAREVDIAVHHLAAAERAEGLADRLRRTVPGAREVAVSELGPVLGAHLGPGAVGVVVAPAAA